MGMKPLPPAVAVAAATALALAGCNSNTKLSAVRGVLTYKGQPMPNVYLRFEPDDLMSKSTSMAVTDAEGRFEMMIGNTAGVFRGNVKVFCDDPQAAMGGKSEVPKEVEPAYRELCRKYGSGKSGHVITIDKNEADLRLNLD
jgi:hypothetical protein